MNIQTNIPLSTLTTMRIGGPANYVCDITSDEDIQQLHQNSKKLGQPVYVMGGGSNLIAHDEGFPGIIARMMIKGVEVLEDTKDTCTVSAGAGEIWDDFVKQMVARELSGIEALSGIPGTVGAAPVQNIGAYGQELADTFVSLEAYDSQTDSFTTLSKEQCGFSYRHSIFRGDQAGRYIITRVTMTLKKTRPQPPFYESLQRYLEQHQIGTMAVTVHTIRQAVLEIRSTKLPDPAQIPSAGSFFKNAIVDKVVASQLVSSYPTMPSYPVDDTHVKIPAGWLIETAGLRGKEFHGMKSHDGNAVVLVNQSATGYNDLAAARQEIIDTVKEKFGITLAQEPLEMQ